MVYPRYYPFSARFARPKGLLVQLRCPGHCTNIPSYTSSPTESDLGWPTLTSKAVTVTHSKNGALVTKLNHWIQGPHHKRKHLTIESTRNNSKPMAVLPHVPVYHVIRCTLIFVSFICMLFTTHHFIIFVNHNRFHKWSSQLRINRHFMRVVNMHVLYIKIVMLCIKV
jgi:hypothetical protein